MGNIVYAIIAGFVCNSNFVQENNISATLKDCALKPATTHIHYRYAR